MDYSILLTTDGKGIEAKREALNRLLARVAELEEHAAGLERAVDHLVQAVPECRPALQAFIQKELKIASK